MSRSAAASSCGRSRASSTIRVTTAVPTSSTLIAIQSTSMPSRRRPALTGRMLLMPLKSDMGDVSRALGCLATEGEIGAAPRRFDIAADRAMPVVEGARVLTPQPSMHGFAEPPAPWRGEPFAADDADSPAPVPRRRPAAGRPPSLPTMPPLFDAPAPRPAIREDETPEERRARFRVISND